MSAAGASPPELESAERSISSLVSADGALTAGAKSTEPPGAKQQASPNPAATATENSPTEFSSNPDQTHLSKLIEACWNTRRSQIGEFDQGWRETLQGSSPPGPSLRNPPLDPDDPRPGPSGLMAADCQDPQPGSSSLKPATHPDDPQPAPSGLEPTPDTDLADPEPAKGTFDLLYDVGEMLGAGSFGRVYKGTRIYDDKQVAIKFVRKRSTERLYRTPYSPKPLFAEVALNLLLQKAPRSQHVLQMYQWFDEPKQRILILEHPQPCETLREFIWNRGGLLDETLACRLMRQAVVAFKHCLDRGVYHNDIKMDNILVNIEMLQLKLIDFGCGFLLKHAYEDNQGRLSQCKPHTDARTVLSLGIILYRMVNGLRTVVSDLDNLKFYVNVSKAPEFESPAAPQVSILACQPASIACLETALGSLLTSFVGHPALASDFSDSGCA
ncbi:serine/threonine-protein kinase pim-2-like [Pseudorasbora parva]|uniref:serine/threonine-protein kinase pim-2-like n=1 Tax=Pseudorasbora parva TaxID=51549 RepID=UPI00351DF7EC